MADFDLSSDDAPTSDAIGPDPATADIFGEPAPAAASAYTVIARKYRPKSFDDLIGQEAMVRTLKNAIARGRIAHAYIFVGPRGTGKTSTARIFAKALNCTGGPRVDFAPDDPAALAIAEGTHLDVIEIDGASNNGVEQVRDLRETTRYAPAQGHRFNPNKLLLDPYAFAHSGELEWNPGVQCSYWPPGR